MAFGKPKEKDPLAEKKTLAQLREEYHKGETPCIIYETDSDKTPYYPTRFPRLNHQFGGRGIRAGAIIELFGAEDSGKSSTAIALAADIQKQAPKGKDCVVMTNFEGPEPWSWWRKLGLNTDKAKFIQMRPKSLEEGIGRGARMVATGEVCVWIIDSVYAGEANESRRQVLGQWAVGNGKGAGISVEARQWGKAWTSVKGLLQENNCTAIAVNQIREVIGDGNFGGFGAGPKTTTPRGKALKFYAWVRAELRGIPLGFDDNSKKIYAGKDGRTVRMKIIKNKTSDVARGMVEYALVRGEGFDLLTDLIDLALEAGAIKASGGGNFTIGKHAIRGRANLQKFVQGSEGVKTAIANAVGRYLEKIDPNDAKEDDASKEEAEDETS